VRNLQLIGWCPLVYFSVNVPPNSRFIPYKILVDSQSQSRCFM
jgi:hypothetical protein